MCASADMSPYCSAHDEWLIMKLCMYVGYHDANNVSNFGGDPIKLKKRLKKIYAVLRAWRTIAVTRPLVLRLLLRNHAQAAEVWKTVAGHTSLRGFAKLKKFKKSPKKLEVGGWVQVSFG